MAEALLAEAVDVRRWLAEDADVPFAERLARDRAVGRSLDAADQLGRIQAWWREVRPGDGSPLGVRLLGLVRLATVVLFAIGLLFGVGVGSLAFAYDGSHPVNLLALLGVLVGMPLGLLLLTLVFLLPGRIPGLASVREAVSVLNPSRWAGAWLDRFSGLTLYGGFSDGQSGFARWQLMVFSQWLACGFFVGVLLVGWILVAVTDLAFGWSTTLNLDAGSVHNLFGTLAAPWVSWLPVAAPDLTLVEASRFYRLESDPVSASRAVQLGGWWPFVLMCVLTYGLAPRLMLLVVGHWRLAAATREMLCQDPEVVALLDRLSPPRVGFVQEADDQSPAASDVAATPPELPMDDRVVVALWNDAVDEASARAWLASRMGAHAGRVIRTGVWQTGKQMRAELKDLTGEVSRLIVFTKGWEPPLLDFADFLSLLRERVGGGVNITVVPIDTGGRSIDAEDREVWAGFIARHRDPRLYVFQAIAADSGIEAEGGP